MKRLLTLFILLAATAGAQPVEKLGAMAGVTVAKVNYILSETRRDEGLEKVIVQVMEVPEGQEVRYFYNRVSLTPGRQHVLVLLVGAYFTGSGGSSAVILEAEPDGYRPITRFTLVNGPILIPSRSSHGWKDLIWLVRGGGVKAHYATLQFDGKSYPANPSSVPATPAGTALSGSAYLADPIHPDCGLRFIAGSK